MSPTNINDYINQVEAPRDTEFSREVSVYRYGTLSPYDRAFLERQFEENAIADSDFGILQQLPPADRYVRTLWARLAPKTLPIVNESGEVTFWRARRVIQASSVVEFYEDERTIGLIVFGGGAGIQNDVMRTLENNFGLRDIRPQRLQIEQMRNIFNRYWRQIRQISLDPSQDINWGGVRDAKLQGSRSRYINTDAEILRNIREDTRIQIRGFKSIEPDMSIEGMKRQINVAFEATPTCVRITARDFEVWDNLLGRAEQVFQDLAREVYFRVTGDEKWVSGIVGSQMLQLKLQIDRTENDAL